MKILSKIKSYNNNMSEPVKASFWYTICNVLQKGMVLLATPIFTRLLTTDQYGTYAIYQSWYNVISIFATLNLSQGAYIKGLVLYEHKEKQFTSSLLTLSSLITAIVGIIYFSMTGFWNRIFDLTTLMMCGMFIALLTMPAMEFWAAKERFDFKYKKYVFISIVTTLLSLVLGILAVVSTTYKVEARIFTDVFAKAIFSIILFVSIMYSGKHFFDKQYWKYALSFNIPLIPHFLSTFILNQVDRIMIGNMVGKSEAALYSVAYSISTIILLVITAINNSLVPYIYKSIKANEESKIRKNTKSIFVLVGALCVFTMAFAPEIITVFAGNKYEDAIWVIPPIAASVFFIFVYSMFSTIEYYFQKTGLIAIASLICAGLNLLLNYIFIPLFGYYAAGYTTLVCYIFFAVMHYIFYRKVLKQTMPTAINLYDIKFIIMISVLVLLIMIIMALIYKWMIIRYSIIAALIFVVLIKRNSIIHLFKALK